MHPLRKRRFALFSWTLLWLVAFHAPLSEAESPKLCRDPRPGSIPLSFSLPNFSPGEFDRVCEARIQRAAARGFTSVTLTPKISFNHKQNAILVGQSLLPGELTRCLETAWKAGFDVIYSPHAEDHTPGEAPIWRAQFDLHPDQTYFLAAFDEFFGWLSRHAGEVARGPQKVRISLETELENSTTQYPNEWNDFTISIRARLSNLNLGGEVPLGIQPNWWPAADPSLWNCSDYESWIASLDFVSPSMYGDWSQVDQGSSQISNRIQDILGKLKRDDHIGCSVDEFAALPYGFGEVGIGADLVHTERWAPVTPSQKPTFLRERAIFYSNLLAWMKTQSGFSFGSSVINVWAYGIYDPAGITQQSSSVPDEGIAESFRAYKAWRCSLNESARHRL